MPKKPPETTLINPFEALANVLGIPAYDGPPDEPKEPKEKELNEPPRDTKPIQPVNINFNGIFGKPKRVKKPGSDNGSSGNADSEKEVHEAEKPD